MGLHSDFQGSRGTLTFFLGNKHTTSKIERLVCMVPPATEFNFNLGQVPTEIPPKIQVQVSNLPLSDPLPMLNVKLLIQVHLSVECAQPFAEPPSMQLSYKMETNAMTQTLKLPVLPSKFLQPFPDISQEMFFEYWKAQQGPPHKQQEFITTPVAVPAASVVALLQSLNFGCRPLALDVNEDNSVGAAYFRFSQAGQEQQLLAQVRIEGNPQGRRQFRVTVCTPNVMLTTKLKDTIMQQLSACR